jgi:hypothetical protein
LDNLNYKQKYMPPKIQLSSLKIALFLSVITFGCASTYKPVSVSGLNYYEKVNVSDTLLVSYRYRVQEITNNGWYAKKEKRYNLAAVAVKIENLSSAPVTITHDNFKVYSAAGEKRVVSPAIYASKVKQRVGVHLLHCLWGPWGISWETKENGETDVHGYYIPAGAIVGIGNAVRASNANSNNKATLEGYEIWNQVIQPGKTMYGLVAIPAAGEEPLTFSFGKTAPLPLPQSVKVPTTSSSPVVRNVGRSNEYNFYVVPQNGNAFNTYTRIQTSGPKHFIIVKDPSKGTSVMYPSDTKTLSRMTPEGRQLLGIPDGDRWLFKILSGKINAYYFLAEENTKIFSDIQKADGPIVPFTTQTLLEMVDGDADAKELISKGKYKEAIKIYNKKK